MVSGEYSSWTHIRLMYNKACVQKQCIYIHTC